MTVKYSSISYLIGEGFRNVFKNKKSTGASLAIMCMAMLIFGIFFMIGENIDHIMKNVQEAQGMQVYILKDATDEQITEVGNKINQIEGVNTIEYISKQDAINQLKEKWKDYSGLLEGYEEALPASYIVTLTDLELNEQVQSKILQIENVDEITSSNETIATLMNLANGVRVFTMVLLVILIIIAIFIISNTIKLTVHARRKEISIMKYVGATNSFIRWPFIVEGMIIGILSGMITIMMTGLAYKIISQKILETEIAKTLSLSLVTFSDMFNLLVIVYLALGIGIGVIGSSISMRKYLKV